MNQNDKKTHSVTRRGYNIISLKQMSRILKAALKGPKVSQ